MNADEIVRALRKEDEGWMGDMTLYELHPLINKAADLIEFLQAQLTESQRRERAAVEDLKNCTSEYGRCAFCKSFNSKGQGTMKCSWRGMLHIETCPDWQYRGPQDAGEGEKG